MPGLVEWEAHQRAVLQAENQLLAEAPQTVPGIEQWEAQHRAALAAQNNRQEEENEGSLESEQATTETAETVATSTSTSATQTGLKSILELSFKRLISKLKQRQNDNQDDENDNNHDDGENSKTNSLSFLSAKKEEESGNSNYLDLLLNSYNLNDKGTQREKSFIKPSSSFDEKLFFEAEYYDYDTGDGDRQRFSNRFRFLYEDDSDISSAVKQSRQLDRSLRRFLSKLDKF